jgi:hypothetical protein
MSQSNKLGYNTKLIGFNKYASSKPPEDRCKKALDIPQPTHLRFVIK